MEFQFSYWCEFLQIVSSERELIHSQKLGTAWVLINSKNLPMIQKRTYFPILFPRYGNSHLPCFRGRIDSYFNVDIFNFFLLLFLWYGSSIVQLSHTLGGVCMEVFFTLNTWRAQNFRIFFVFFIVFVVMPLCQSFPLPLGMLWNCMDTCFTSNF